MKLSVIIPAHNEEAGIDSTVRVLHATLVRHNIDHEILVVNDNSTDETAKAITHLSAEIATLKLIHNTPPHGFGFAVRQGLAQFTGDAVAIFMADAADSPEDLVTYFRTMKESDVDCVFGSRFMKGAKVVDYPTIKLFLNRLANTFIQLLFRHHYNDTTNSFKLYSRRAIDLLQPLLSHHFNLTVELPLKAVIRGCSYTIVPNSWINRKTGASKFAIQEMGSRYLFIVLYCFIEKWLSKGDYRKRVSPIPPDQKKRL